MSDKFILRFALSALIISSAQANSYQNTMVNPAVQGNSSSFHMIGSAPLPTSGNANYQPSMLGSQANPMTNSGLGPQMGFSNSLSTGSFNDPQYALDDPYIGMDPQELVFDPNKNMDAPGIVNPFSIQSLVDNANSKVSPQELQGLQLAVQAYVDGNLGDARKHFSAVADRFPESVATDRAYLGLAKIERAYGAYDVSRRILEAVIRKNRDYESIMLARRSYKDLQAEVHRSVAASQRDMDGAYAVYKQIGWLNIFSKIRAYNNYKDAKANFEGVLISSKQFDPIFAQVNISTPIPGANISGPGVQDGNEVMVPEEVQRQIDDSLTIQELAAQSTPYIPPTKQASFLNPSGQVNQTINIASETQDKMFQQVNTSSANVAPLSTVNDATPVASPVPQKPVAEMNMSEAREAYLKIYEELKQALKGDDARLKQKLQVDYRAALQRYNELKTSSKY